MQVALAQDKVAPNYERVEELFSQKVIDKTDSTVSEQKPKKKTEEVSYQPISE